MLLQAMAGIGSSLISLLTISMGFPTWGLIVYPKLKEFPLWALKLRANMTANMTANITATVGAAVTTLATTVIPVLSDSQNLASNITAVNGTMPIV